MSDASQTSALARGLVLGGLQADTDSNNDGKGF